MAPPTVSFLLLAYNQEAFIADAVRSVLAQDYEPLEIILSDDCSADGTFDIIEREARAYQGPHSVTLNRNETNMGIEHINKLQQMAEGEILVTGHGDDIAMPERTRRLAAAMIEQVVSLVSSNAEMTDEAGKTLGLFSNVTSSEQIVMETMMKINWASTMLGATFALRREICTRFPPMNREKLPAGGWDHVAPFRACLLKGMYYLAEPLIRYRQHGRNMSALVVDRTGSVEAHTEIAAAHDINSNLYMLDDIIAFRAEAPENKELIAVQSRLQAKILHWADRWRGLRNQLIVDGKRPTWVDKSVLEAQPLNPVLIPKPRLPKGSDSE